MNSAARSCWLRTLLVVIGVLVAGGIGFSGCTPATQGPATPEGESGEDLVGTPAEPEEPAPAEPEEPAPAEPEEPAPAEPEEPAPAEPEEPAPAEPEEPEPAVPDLSVDVPVSKYAPAEDLVAQVESYVEDLEEAVDTEEEYGDSVDEIAQKSNTLILIALALGLHDTENAYQAAAPAMLKAAQELAATSDYASAQAGVAAVKESLSASGGNPDGLKWEKVASMEELMEAVPLIHSRLKRYLRGSRFESMADDSAGYSAVLAVIAQGSMANSGDTDKPNEVEKWHTLCLEMRDVCAAVNTAIRAQDQEATDAAMEKLNQNCDDCHAVFHPE